MGLFRIWAHGALFLQATHTLLTYCALENTLIRVGVVTASYTHFTHVLRTFSYRHFTHLLRTFLANSLGGVTGAAPSLISRCSVFVYYTF
jgi:hypothetical protein